MTVNNFQQLRPYLQFESDDDFYVGAIWQRRKDGNKQLSADNVGIRDFYFRSLDHFDGKEHLIRQLCGTLNARFYLNLNRRSFHHTALYALEDMAARIRTGAYHKVKTSYATAAGKHHNESYPVWIVDIDDIEQSRIDDIVDALHHVRPDPGAPKIQEMIATKNGFHLLTKPFDLVQFRQHGPICHNVTVYKNNPTLVYML